MQPPTRAFGPKGPEVFRGVSERVSPKIGVSGGVSRVPRVSPECQKGVWTLRRHSRDTFWTLWGPGPEGPPRHSPGHSLRHPDFRGHSLGHSRDTSGPKGPKPPVGGWGCLNSFNVFRAWRPLGGLVLLKLEVR